MSTPTPRSSHRTSIHRPRQLSQLREMHAKQMLGESPPGTGMPAPARGPPAAGEQRRPAGRQVPASRSARLPRAQVQLSLMALYLLPDASFCSFRRISSILTFSGTRPPTAKGARGRSGTPLPGPARPGGHSARQHPAPRGGG